MQMIIEDMHSHVLVADAGDLEGAVLWFYETGGTETWLGRIGDEEAFQAP